MNLAWGEMPRLAPASVNSRHGPLHRLRLWHPTDRNRRDRLRRHRGRPGHLQSEDLPNVLKRLVEAEPCAGFVVGMPGLVLGTTTDGTRRSGLCGPATQNPPGPSRELVDEDDTSRKLPRDGAVRDAQVKRREKGQLAKSRHLILSGSSTAVEDQSTSSLPRKTSISLVVFTSSVKRST